MPAKCTCSNHTPFNQRCPAGTCFRRGVGVGYRLATRASIKKRPLLQDIRKKPLSEMTLRELGQVASQLKIPSYSKLNKEQLYNAVKAKGYRPL